jgi:hypothetical protein
MIYPANPLPFIASDAAVGFIRICLLFFKGPHGLGEGPRLGLFFPIEKGLASAAMSGNVKNITIVLLTTNQN